MADVENTGAAPAAEPAPALAEAPQKPQATPADAAPAQLTPYQKRKERERKLAEEAAARKAKREAAKAGKAGKGRAAEAPAAAQAEPTADEWDEDQRRREVGGFWRLTLRIIGWCLLPFGYQLDQLTDKECAEDVALLAPLASRHRWLEVTVRYAALPTLLAERIAGKVKRREAPPPADAQAPAKVKGPTKP